MSYINVNQVLPKEVIELIQSYVDGQYIYIPRKDETRKEWGQNTRTKEDLRERNRSIYREYQDGKGTAVLAEKYYLSIKSIQRIVLQEKRSA